MARVVLALVFVSACAAVHPASDNGADAGVGLGGGVPDLAMAQDTAVPRDTAMPAMAPVDLATAPADMATAPADLGPFPPGTIYNVSNKATGKMLSIHNQSTLNNSITEERGANNGPDQRWQLQAAGSGYQLVNDQSKTCLDVQDGLTSDGATTWIEPCSSAASQVWLLADAGSGFYTLVNANSQSCLDLDHGYTADGTVIFQYKCNNGDNQKWSFIVVK